MARRPVRRGALRSSNQYDQLKVKLPITILRSEFANGATGDGSILFNLFHLPWNAIHVTGSNRVGAAAMDISKMTALFRYYKCTGVHYDLYRPSVYIANANGIQVIKQEQSMGYQVMHSTVIDAPNTVTSDVEVNVNLQRKVSLSEPVSWTECIDDDKNFTNLGSRRKVSIGWKPKTTFERQWRDVLLSDSELAYGGIHIRYKSDDPIPNLTGFAYSQSQVLLQGTVSVYMAFKQRR